ncbi:hypothetical protein WN944_006076 [Citrus x changshan-huyou]|uniref:Uncharacterized protein n=1 Tax=Citrus x changshan-huyou TaxID=2935761 RepID=A0AAP0ML05_9ROSI
MPSAHAGALRATSRAMSTATLPLHQETQPDSNAFAMLAMDVSIYLGQLRVAVRRLGFQVYYTLEITDEGLDDEGKALLLVSSLPKSCENFVNALMYRRQTLTLDEVKKKGYFKKDCPERKNKPKDLKNQSGDTIIVEEEVYESGSLNRLGKTPGPVRVWCNPGPDRTPKIETRAQTKPSFCMSGHPIEFVHVRATFVSTCCEAACSSHITLAKFYFSTSKTWELATCYGTLSVNAKREEIMPVLPTEQNRVSKCQTRRDDAECRGTTVTD